MMSCLLDIQNHNVETHSPRARSQNSCNPLSDKFKPNFFFHFCQETQTIFSAHRRGRHQGSPSLPCTLDILPELVGYQSSLGLFRYMCGPLRHLYCADWSAQLSSVPSMVKVAWKMTLLAPEDNWSLTESFHQSILIWYHSFTVVIWIYFILCFTTTFLHTHSWINWVDADDWWGWGWLARKARIH